MTIEEQIFQRTTIIVSKLIPFGFQKINDEYIIKKNILNNTFVIKVSIKNNQQVEEKFAIVVPSLIIFFLRKLIA